MDGPGRQCTGCGGDETIDPRGHERVAARPGAEAVGGGATVQGIDEQSIGAVAHEVAGGGRRDQRCEGAVQRQSTGKTWHRHPIPGSSVAKANIPC